MHSDSESAYREFVAANLDQLGRFAYLLCRDWHRAEDAVQRALTKLYVRWDRVPLRSPGAYARKIVANELTNETRRKWFRRERVSSQLPERAEKDPYGARLDRLTMLDALARLPRRQRLAVVLRYWEDNSVEDTAQIMRCSTGNVKSQTARGLQTLRDYLAETEPKRAEGAMK